MKIEKRIKFVTRGSKPNAKWTIYARQSEDSKGLWKNKKFIFDATEQNYDWYVVIDDVPKCLDKNREILNCPAENTILITTEPSSITFYGKGFANQFNYLITNQDEKFLPHRNAIRSQTGIYWLYGKELTDILKDNEGIKKTKKFSTICSDKRDGHTLMHKKRYDFTALLEKEIPKLERFGRGFNFVEEKYEALDNYEFHLCIENYISPHLWSEKLADTFLGFCVPIYCGCPNIYDYFPTDSLIVIDIDDIEGSIEKINKIIATPGEYERRLPAIKEARRRVIEEYNLLAMVSNIVDKTPTADYVSNKKIYTRRVMRVRNLPDLFRFVWFRIKKHLNIMS